MKYLLDTNACIAYLRNPVSMVGRRLAKHPPADIVLCAVVVTELFYGVLRSTNPTRQRIGVETFINRFVSLPFDNLAAEAAARARAELVRRGTPISPNDLLIAAIALAHNLTLVTHNTREFSRVDGLSLEDWETGP